MTNSGLFRRLAHAEDMMMRAAMPRVDANDPKVLQRAVATLPRRTSTAVKTLTFKMSEVTR